MSTSSSERADRLQRYLADDPGNLELMVDCVDALLDSRRIADADAALRIGLVEAPQDRSLRYRKALVDQLSGIHEAALDQLAGLIDEGVDSPALHMARARSLMALGRPDEALAGLDGIHDDALDEVGHDQMIYIRARSLHHLGRVDEAIQLAETALKGRDPIGSPLTSALVTLYLDAVRLDDARKLVRRAAQAGSLDAELIAADGFLALDGGHASAAEHLFRESLSRAKGEGRTHLGLGLSLATQGNLDDAESSLQRAAQLMPSHLGTWHALAWIRLSRDDVVGARAAFETSLEKDRTFADSHGAMAILDLLQGDRSAAERWIRTGIKLDSASPTIAAAQAMYDSGATSLRDPRFIEQALTTLQRPSVNSRSGIQAMLNALKR